MAASDSSDSQELGVLLGILRHLFAFFLSFFFFFSPEEGSFVLDRLVGL